LVMKPGLTLIFPGYGGMWIDKTAPADVLIKKLKEEPFCYAKTVPDRFKVTGALYYQIYLRGVSEKGASWEIVPLPQRLRHRVKVVNIYRYLNAVIPDYSGPCFLPVPLELIIDSLKMIAPDIVWKLPRAPDDLLPERFEGKEKVIGKFEYRFVGWRMGVKYGLFCSKGGLCYTRKATPEEEKTAKELKIVTGYTYTQTILKLTAVMAIETLKIEAKK